MKDRLYEIAFEDGPGSDVELGERDRRELLRLRELKAELTQLRDVPECQLSADRLRRALLDRGIRPRRPARHGMALALPGVAATVALALALVPRPPTKVPGLEAGSSLAYADPAAGRDALPEASAHYRGEPTPSQREASSTASPAARGFGESAPPAPRARAAVPRAGAVRADSASSPPSRSALGVQGGAAAAGAKADPTGHPEAAKASIQGEPAPGGDARTEPESVIVVYDATHAGTGVQIATERHDARNLVAGY